MDWSIWLKALEELQLAASISFFVQNDSLRRRWTQKRRDWRRSYTAVTWCTVSVCQCWTAFTFCFQQQEHDKFCCWIGEGNRCQGPRPFKRTIANRASQALGIKWNVEDDVFCFNVVRQSTTSTRRSMFSIVASIFDPLGFLSPFTLTGKKILQTIRQGNIEWNEPLPAERLLKWETWIKDLQNLDLIKLQVLHHFSYANKNGYGQCSYLRAVNGREVHCALVIAKSRVAPLKVVTISRLELTAAVLSVKVSLFLKKEINLPIDREYFCTDSKVVLGYMNNEAYRIHVYVANRVQIIRDATEPHQW